MSCFESPYVMLGFSWSSPHAILTPLYLYDSYTGKVRIDDRGGSVLDINIVEGGMYTFEDSPSPFTLEVLLSMKGSSPATSLMAFETCDIEVEEEPPSDLLGMLTYVKDQVIAIFAGITAINTTISFFDTIITSISVVVNEIKTLISDLSISFNQSMDALEIWVTDTITTAYNGIISDMILYKTEIITVIEDKMVFDPAEILEPIKAEIVQLGSIISDEIISKVWDYIESQLFEDET